MQSKSKPEFEMTNFSLLQRLLAPADVKRAEKELSEVKKAHDERLSRIRVIEDELNSLICDEKPTNGHVVFTIGDQEYLADNLFSSDKARVVRVSLPEGTEIPEHYHTQTEILSVLEGSVVLTIDVKEASHVNCSLADGAIVMSVASSVMIKPGTCHSVSVIQDTSILATILPTQEHESIISSDLKGYPPSERFRLQ